MALQSIAKKYFSKPELVLGTLPRFCEHKVFEQSYKQVVSDLRGINGADARDIRTLFIFPFNTFKKFPKSTVNSLVKFSYDIVKNNKSLMNTVFYNTLLSTYIKNHIDFDVSTILKDMKNYGAELNGVTFGLLISLYSKRGDMNSVKHLLDVMKSKQLHLNDRSKCEIYGGYIRAGQLQELQQFIEEENIDESSIDYLTQKCEILASVGKFNEAVEILKKVLKMDSEIFRFAFGRFYEGLVKSNASESQLDEALELMSEVKTIEITLWSIFNLNRDGYYRQSLKFLLKIKNQIKGDFIASDIVQSFQSIDCPINVYKIVIENFGHKLQKGLHLFPHMDFATAYKLSAELMNKKNEFYLSDNLIKKAMENKSVNDVVSAFDLTMKRLPIRAMNIIIEFVLIPGLLNNGMVTNAKEILQLMPNHKRVIFPSLLIHFLSLGDFDSFHSLIATNKKYGNIKYINFTRTNSKRFLENVPFTEIHRLATEAGKVFSPFFVNWFISSIVTEEFIKLSKINDDNRLQECINVAKSIGLRFSKTELDYVKKHVPGHLHYFDQLEVDNEQLDEGESESSLSQ